MEVPQKPYANITKSFVHLAAQICFMKNCWNPSSMSAATGACTRHYHPTLSIWLSVDPMSDKYPGVSPYTYCTDNPVMIKDPNGTHGVIVLHQERNLDIVWRGKVRFQLHLPATATLRMTYYYSIGSTQGSLSAEEIAYVQNNITKNLDPLVGQTISVDGNSYRFSYNINYMAVQNATEEQLQVLAGNAKYSNLMVGNYIWSGITNAEKQQAGVEDAYGVASDNYMKLDFPKIFAHIKSGQHDGQVAIHEFLHNIGAGDVESPGDGIMNYYENTDQYTNTYRVLKMTELNNIINSPQYSHRISIVNE